MIYTAWLIWSRPNSRTSAMKVIKFIIQMYIYPWFIINTIQLVFKTCQGVKKILFLRNLYFFFCLYPKYPHPPSRPAGWCSGYIKCPVYLCYRCYTLNWEQLTQYFLEEDVNWQLTRHDARQATTDANR